MKHYGDITKISGYEVPVVDVVTGGSPCQDLSVAGKRAGLDGERSGLFMEQIRVIKEMRDADKRNGRTNQFIRPRYMVWENVPGAFSSNKGEDFRVVLEETARIVEKDAVIPGPPKGKWTPAGCIMGDGWSISWRVHDAQFWGVPQRRKRISLVADFGGHTAPEILFERKGLSGNIEQSEQTGKETAGNVGESIDTAKSYTLKIRGGKEVDSNGRKAGKGALIQTELSGTLGVSQDQTLVTEENPVLLQRRFSSVNTFTDGIAPTLEAGAGEGGNNMPMVLENHPQDSRVLIKEDGVFQTLDARMGMGGGNTPMVMDTYQKTTGSLMASGYDKLGTQEAANDMYVVQGQSWDGGQVSPTLTSRNAGGAQRMPDKDNFNAVISFTTEMTPKTDEEDIAFSLRQRDYKDPQSVSYGVDCYNQSQVEEEKIGAQVAKGPGAVCARDYKGVGNQFVDEGKCVVGSLCARDYKGYVVRRLTPMECERLQNFPDGWTDIGDWVDSKGKTHKGDADSPRYKALGNSIALPFWEWMLKRIMKYLPENPTMASLFSGIGGFELCSLRAGIKPLFNSEIESFPEAVTTKHFGDEERGIKGDYEKYL